MKDLPLPILRQGLERKYQACLALEQGFNLVIALHDYIHYINEHPTIDYLFTEKIQKGAGDIFDQIRKEEIKTEKELDKVYSELEKLIKKHKIKDQKVLLPLDEYKNYKSGRYLSSLGKVEPMHNELRDIIEALTNSENRELVSKYVIPPSPKETGPRFGRVNLSASFKEYELLKDRFEKQSEVSAWGAFDAVFKSYKAIRAYAYDIQKDQENQSFLADSKFIASAVESIKRESEWLGTNTHSAKPFFFREYSNAVLSRLHLALLDELDNYGQVKDQKLPEGVRERLDTGAIIESFSGQGVRPETSIKDGNGYFRFNREGQPVKVGKVKNQPFKLLEILVADPFEAYKKVENIFEGIWGNKYKDNKSPDSLNFKIQKIEQVLKELQRIKEFKGSRLELDFSPDSKRGVRLIITAPVEKS